MTSPIRGYIPPSTAQNDLRTPQYFLASPILGDIESATTTEKLDMIEKYVREKRSWLEKEIEADIRRKMFENVLGKKS
jgi:hypothetical protein